MFSDVFVYLFTFIIFIIKLHIYFGRYRGQLTATVGLCLGGSLKLGAWPQFAIPPLFIHERFD